MGRLALRAGGAELFPVLPLPLRPGRTAGCLRLGASTHVMGVLNVTPDSFSDGGQLGHLDDVLARAADMLAAGERLRAGLSRGAKPWQRSRCGSSNALDANAPSREFLLTFASSLVFVFLPLLQAGPPTLPRAKTCE